MENPIEEIADEVKVLMMEAYKTGYQHGVVHQNNVNEKLSNPRIILKDFITFVKGFKLVMYDEQKMFSTDEYIITDESLVSNFLMRTDYEEKD